MVCTCIRKRAHYSFIFAPPPRAVAKAARQHYSAPAAVSGITRKTSPYTKDLIERSFQEV